MTKAHTATSTVKTNNMVVRYDMDSPSRVLQAVRLQHSTGRAVERTKHIEIPHLDVHRVLGRPRTLPASDTADERTIGSVRQHAVERHEPVTVRRTHRDITTDSRTREERQHTLERGGRDVGQAQRATESNRHDRLQEPDHPAGHGKSAERNEGGHKRKHP